MTSIKIGKKVISINSPTFIVAELSANHHHNINIALKTIKAAKESGADAVKFQTYTPDTITLNCNNKYFRIKGGTIWDGRTLYDLYKEAYMPWEWQPRLKKYAESIGLECFSTPFDKTAVNFLKKRLNVPAYKIASFEINDIPLIEYAASKGKPIILSTGIATLQEIKEAIVACKRVGNSKIILLKCVSAYPAPLEDMNLKVIPDMIKKFHTIVGLSDHTNGIIAPATAVVLGAKIIEKHLILDRKLGGPDAKFSLEPHEFKEMVNTIRQTEKALGKITYLLPKSVKKSRQFMRSLFAVKDIKKGEKLTTENVKSIRPANGLPPIYLKKILGKKSKTDIKRGTPLVKEMVQF